MLIEQHCGEKGGGLGVGKDLPMKGMYHVFGVVVLKKLKFRKGHSPPQRFL